MRTYRLMLDVPVVWLPNLTQSSLSANILPAGTVLDNAPLVVVSEGETSQQAVAVRVNGMEGFVSVFRLKEALPGWRPGSDRSEDKPKQPTQMTPS